MQIKDMMTFEINGKRRIILRSMAVEKCKMRKLADRIEAAWNRRTK